MTSAILPPRPPNLLPTESELSEIEYVRFPRYIAIEGIDGTGKSTLASRLASHLGYALFRSPAPPFSDPDFRKRIDSLDAFRVRPWAYRAACANDALFIEQHLLHGGLVSDRSPISTWASSGDAFGSADSPPEWFWTDLPRPDAIIVLTASKSMCLDRITSRHSQDPERCALADALEGNHAFQSSMESHFQNLARTSDSLHVLAIDTDPLAPEEVFDKALALLSTPHRPV